MADDLSLTAPNWSKYLLKYCSKIWHCRWLTMKFGLTAELSIWSVCGRTWIMIENQGFLRSITPIQSPKWLGQRMQVWVSVWQGVSCISPIIRVRALHRNSCFQLWLPKRTWGLVVKMLGPLIDDIRPFQGGGSIRAMHHPFSLYYTYLRKLTSCMAFLLTLWSIPQHISTLFFFAMIGESYLLVSIFYCLRRLYQYVPFHLLSLLLSLRLKFYYTYFSLPYYPFIYPLYFCNCSALKRATTVSKPYVAGIYETLPGNLCLATNVGSTAHAARDHSGAF